MAPGLHVSPDGRCVADVGKHRNVDVSTRVIAAFVEVNVAVSVMGRLLLAVCRVNGVEPVRRVGLRSWRHQSSNHSHSHQTFSLRTKEALSKLNKLHTFIWVCFLRELSKPEMWLSGICKIYARPWAYSLTSRRTSTTVNCTHSGIRCRVPEDSHERVFAVQAGARSRRLECRKLASLAADDWR